MSIVVVSRRVAALLFLTTALAAAPRPPSDANLARFTPWFTPPEFMNPRLSPTGEYLGFTLREQDTYALGFFDFATGKLSVAGGRGDMIPLDFWWKGPRRLMVHVVSNTGNRRAYSAFDLDGKNPEELHSIRETAGQILDPLPAEPHHLLMAHSAEVFRLDLRNGKTTKVAGDNGHMHRWFIDGNGDVRAGSIRRPDGSRTLWWRSSAQGNWRAYKMAPEDRGIRAINFDADPRYLWVWDFTSPPANRLSKFDTTDGTLHPVLGGQGLDPTHVLAVGRFRHPVAALYTHEHPVRVEPLTEARRPAVELLRKRFVGYTPVIVDCLPDGKTWVVWAEGSRFPGGYFLFDSQTGKTSLIATGYNPALKESLFVGSTPIAIESSSGAKIKGRAWLPPGLARPPLIVLCPGSVPTMPASDEFNPFIQTYVALGYAVAIFDGQGATSYGHDADVMLGGSVAQTIRQDLEDGVAGLAKQGLVDGDRAVLFGEGMAGAIALSVAEVSSKFRAVTSLNAPVEIERDDLLFLTEDASGNKLADRLGGWRQSGKAAEALSPIKVAPKVAIPALHLVREEPWSPGKFSESGRRLERAVKSSAARPRVELAYSWFQGFTPPSTYARERAAAALRIVDFYNEALTASKK